MSEKFLYPSIPSIFFVQRTPGKARLFVGELGSRFGSLVPVTTVSVGTDSEANRLVSALTNAAWTGDRREWEGVATDLPAAVVLACNQALVTLPPPESLALGSDGEPMTVLRDSYAFTPGADDLSSMVAAAYDLSLQALVDNYRGDGGEVYCRVRVLSGEAEVTREQVGSVWPHIDEHVPLDRRIIGSAELGDALNDARWKTQRTRAYWVWIIKESLEEPESGTYISEAVWVVEHFDQDVPDDPEPDELEDWELFLESNWNPWPMTARTRFVLWNALVGLQTMLELGLGEWEEGNPRPDDDEFMRDFPAIVLSQPRIWWESLLEACGRLEEAMRTGQRWNPRTAAEEALIYVACQKGWIEAAHDAIDERSTLRSQLASLPEGKEFEFDELGGDEADGGPDYDWDEVPGALTGDEDIALLWMAAMDGIGHPEDPTNHAQGIGDYRAASWHQPFDRYRQDPEAPSALY